MLSQIQAEYGKQGVLVFGLGIMPLGPDALPQFRKLTSANFPLGTISDDAARTFLQHGVMYRFLVPQVVIIDRKGVIRYHFGGAQDTDFIRNEDQRVRQALDVLMAENPTPKPKSKAAPAKTSGAPKK